MVSLNISATSATPAIIFDFENGNLSISGRSIHENPVEFYKPLLEWLNEYALHPCALTIFNINFDYLNTSSSKYLFAILKKMKLMADSGNSISINWHNHIDDEDMLQTGQVYSEILEMSFEFISYDN